MHIIEFNNAGQMAQEAALMVKEELRLNPELLFCAATGNSPLPLYGELALESDKHEGLFKNFRLIPLDEWIGLETPKGSCDAYLQKHLIGPLKISKDRYLRFNEKARDPQQECSRIRELLKREGPIDLCVLGLGKNGHLGLNEPSDVLQPHCHLADLTPESQQHAMLEDSSTKPIQGITLGMQDILASGRILIIVSGAGKESAKQALFSKKVDPQWPATFLWQHDNVDCLVVKSQ